MMILLWAYQHGLLPRAIILLRLGMTGFDGRGWLQTASRERAEPDKSAQPLSANRTTYAALPLAA